jgi:hypothetical protein
VPIDEGQNRESLGRIEVADAPRLMGGELLLRFADTATRPELHEGDADDHQDYQETKKPSNHPSHIPSST